MLNCGWRGDGDDEGLYVASNLVKSHCDIATVKMLRGLPARDHDIVSFRCMDRVATVTAERLVAVGADGVRFSASQLSGWRSGGHFLWRRARYLAIDKTTPFWMIILGCCC